MAPEVERSGLTLAIENEGACVLGTTERIPELLEAVGSPSVRAIWDPANGAHDGELPYPTAFERIVPWAVHVHLKDGQHVAGRWEQRVVGEGEVGLLAISRGLVSSGYEGWVALETHYRPRAIGADFSRPSGEAFSELGEEGTYACLKGWERVLQAAG